MKKYNVLALPGDGIGPEIVRETIRVVDAISAKSNFSINWTQGDIGGISIDKNGEPLTRETLERAKKSDAVLLGAVGGPKWDNLPGGDRPERGLLAIREGLELFCNLRPANIYSSLKSASPLKDEILSGGLDILIVRELTGGIYFGERGRDIRGGEISAYDTERYSVSEIQRIARWGFESAMKRSKKLCSVDKANVLESSRLWREVVIDISKDYPEVELTHMYVDNAAMQLVRNPRQFDVIVTSNIFGDILSDEASQITGSIGLLASASLSNESLGLYEPVHGSAPDIAGKNIANPIACILSGAMMLKYTFGEEDAAHAIERAVERALEDGIRSSDIAKNGEKVFLTFEITDEILKRL